MSENNLIQTKITTESLPCELTDVERLDYADKLAEANDAVERAIENKKSAVQTMNAEIKLAVAHRDNINNKVATKREYRDVDVELKFDFGAKTVSKTRTDTGETISSRPMTEKEKQSNIFDELGGEN